MKIYLAGSCGTDRRTQMQKIATALRRLDYEVYCPFELKIENAWEELRGIREYYSEDELIDSVMFVFGRRNGFDHLYLADFIPEEHSIGEDLDTFVDICMDSAEEYEI